ncbi:MULTISPECIES: isoamylase early set domain-containing protein [Marinomonas]|jgi:1,4-alpha-glucan branching enzyme|uniref:isoamylase early set domain-containing protein n=2 Tax=Oceanospirillaceae TaxID=135620 RepID=UPI001FB6E2A1|nr:isoamylase early set domain-containing protein [Marinomonas sp. KMM3893]
MAQDLLISGVSLIATLNINGLSKWTMELEMIEKKYLKTKPECKVKFALPADKVGTAKSVAVVGDFNNWDCTANPMKKQKSGVFASTLSLEVNAAYQFRYVLDGTQWLNDDMADDYVPSPISYDNNGVISL